VSEDRPHGPEPSLAGERTDLAWNRSGLALLACGAAVIHGFPPAALSARHVAGVIVLVLGGVTWMLGAFDARRRTRLRMGRVATPGDLLPVALAVAGVGVAAFTLAAFSPG
jgi:putative membrane protein